MNPYAILAGLVLAIGLCLGGASVGKRLERTKWQEKEIAAAKASQAAILAGEQRYLTLQQSNEATARKASADHEKAISDLTRQSDALRASLRAAGGLRVSRAICAGQDHGAPAAPGAGRPDDATSGTVALPEVVSEDLQRLMQKSDELAERLRALQGWVKDAGLYGTKP